jgi:hypothetical protein
MFLLPTSTRLIVALTLFAAITAQAAIKVETSPTATPRELYGAERVSTALESIPDAHSAGLRIIIGTKASPQFAPFAATPNLAPSASEGFHLLRIADRILVIGSDPSGALYGSLEFAKRIQTQHAVPAQLDITDHPVFSLRGPCIGMQKPAITYDGAMYDYRYTPQEFPFFYNKQLWLRYLDLLADNRLNTLYLWNGHPFTSLLKLPKYPEAQELPDTQLQQNIEMFRWLTAEADKRGIWVIQAFYNIHISHTLAKAHGVPFHQTTPTEFASQYTCYCISEFIKNYPHVGLMMTLGEALGPQYGKEWLTQTIIPGVRDGMRELGVTAEPPIIVRAHATDVEPAIRSALTLYKNIYTMWKWTGESLTWTDIRGQVLERHEMLVHLGATHIVNIHLLSNLEPFRWGDPEYIQQVMRSCQRIGIRGLHFYPLRYWEWPVTAENPPELQIDRDWIWFEAWARYAWNPNRNVAAEREYWIGRIAEKYGTHQAAADILDAYQQSGVCAPRLLPRIGITEGNRQSLTLGMLMPQLIDPDRYNAATTLWTADAPPGERLADYVRREWRHEPHEGETPISVAKEVVESATLAVRSAEAARPYVTKNVEEFDRFLNDMRCIQAEMEYYAAKTRAAALVLRYGYSSDLEDLKKAAPPIEESLVHYRKLVSLTDKTYREGPGVDSVSRRIPFLGGPGRYTHWRDCLPAYEKEFASFQQNLLLLEKSGARSTAKTFAPLPPVVPTLSSSNGEVFEIQPGAKLFTDSDAVIDQVAPELKGLTGIRISREATQQQGVSLHFHLPEPAQILVGFYRGNKKDRSAKPPADEWNPTYRNGVLSSGTPPITVWVHALPKGDNDLDFGKGAYVVLGFTKKDAEPEPRIVFAGNANISISEPGGLDWLFE